MSGSHVRSSLVFNVRSPIRVPSSRVKPGRFRQECFYMSSRTIPIQNPAFRVKWSRSHLPRLMDIVMAGINLEICLVYLDDIIVFSSNLQEHLQRLRSVFQRIYECGLKLKPSKCSLLQKSVTFLGHIVSAEGVATDPEKVRLVREWPTPTNLTELRSFLGLAGYYRKYISGYARIASPLTSLTKKGNDSTGVMSVNLHLRR